MKNKKLIVGIDPGTTVGLAILDSKGKLLKLESGKEISSKEILMKIIEPGKPLIIATDKADSPSFVKDVSTKLECQLFSPQEDLSQKKKRYLTKDLSDSIENKHEEDALSAAIYAFKQSKHLFRRIRSHFKDEEKIKEVKEKVLLGKAKNIEEALDD